MIACVGPISFVFLAIWFVYALVLLRLAIARDRAVTPPTAPAHVVIVRAKTPPYDWQREGL